MKKTHILSTVSMLALGTLVALSTAARADERNGERDGYNRRGHDFVDTFAFAANYGDVYFNYARTEGGTARARIENSGEGAQGVIQMNQNVGPNSQLQNAAAVASIEGHAGDSNSVVSHAFNWGTVNGNISERGQCGDDCGGGTGNSASIEGSFGNAQGVLNLNQNAGDNSLLQNATGLAAFQYCGPDCVEADVRAVAVAVNWGDVQYNQAAAARSHASARIAGSFGGAQGVINVNQNAGANSLLQNSASIASIRPSR